MYVFIETVSCVAQTSLKLLAKDDLNLLISCLYLLSAKIRAYAMLRLKPRASLCMLGKHSADRTTSSTLIAWLVPSLLLPFPLVPLHVQLPTPS